MEQININAVNNYESLKNALNQELNASAVHFCRIGYLLKRARDERNILTDSSYTNVNEFASAEFGLDASQVSRFIRINDRFSIGGYSEHLKFEYEQYGSAKLSLMLTLPDAINEELSPDMSKSEINTIKTEYEAEQKISDLEVMMEEKEDGPDEFVAMIVKELNDEHPDAAIYLNDTMKLAAKMGMTVNDADIMEAYIPDGVATYSIRIPGQGRFMVSMKPEGITILNMRDPENKSPLTWQEFKDVLLEDMKARDFPEETKKPEKKKTEKVKPAKPKTDMGKTIAAVEKEALDSSVAPVQQEIVKNEPEIVQEEESLPFPEVMPEEKQPEPQSDEEHSAAGPEEKDPVDITHPGLYLKVKPEDTIKAVSFNEAHPAAGVEKVEGEEFTPEDQVIEELHDSIRNLEDQIIARNWTRALIYVEDIEFRIKRMKGV